MKHRGSGNPRRHNQHVRKLLDANRSPEALMRERNPYWYRFNQQQEIEEAGGIDYVLDRMNAGNLFGRWRSRN